LVDWVAVRLRSLPNEESQPPGALLIGLDVMSWRQRSNQQPPPSPSGAPLSGWVALSHHSLSDEQPRYGHGVSLIQG